MCVFWTVIGLLCLLASMAVWAGVRIYAASRDFWHPEIIEDVPHEERNGRD